MSPQEQVWVSILSDWRAVLTFIAFAFTTMSGVVVWFDRRAKKRADQTKHEIAAENRDVETKLGAMEMRLGRVEDEMEGLEKALDAVQRDMGHLARADDVARLQVAVGKEMSAIGATMKEMNGQVRMLYEAALRSGQKMN